MEQTKYPTVFKNIFCDVCGDIATHISENGSNFKCLRCEAVAIRNIINREPVY